ncbi:hypothetical protein GUJ93_ZPchr0001g30753 [Zizania palustris]|uniref:Uncharacterized protein n=1 Tax=Zizania palustris TaxID=103762 RepID=A0A8J5SDS1_ZIZPA|nr:hypothetical protein GUJ93_ZPchr0001g30753 [Zizania palustris]
MNKTAEERTAGGITAALGARHDLTSPLTRAVDTNLAMNSPAANNDETINQTRQPRDLQKKKSRHKSREAESNPGDSEPGPGPRCARKDAASTCSESARRNPTWSEAPPAKEEGIEEREQPSSGRRRRPGRAAALVFGSRQLRMI